MKLFRTFIIAGVTLLWLYSCTSSKLIESNHYTNDELGLKLDLPSSNAVSTTRNRLSKTTKRAYNKYVKLLETDPEEKVLFYARNIDNLYNRIPYNAIGSLVSKVDTNKIKTNGFANRKTNNQSYLHKTSIDKANRVVSSEYIVPLGSNYFYLFTAASIRTILNDEEAIIVVQDSLNRKYSAAIGSFQHINK